MFPKPEPPPAKPWRNNVSVTSGPSSLPPASAPQTGQPARTTATAPSTAPAGAAQGALAPASEVPNSPSPNATAIGFSLSYDSTTGRMILEAREPGSGFIIYQMPPKYVVKQFTATVGGIEPARGGQVDGTA